MPERADVIVVGAGVIGSAAARALARRGRDVVLLERFAIGHDRGSSHGASRIFRFSYADPEYVRMATESLALWRELEDDSSEELVTTTGGLDVGDDLEPQAEVLHAAGAAYEWLDGAEVRERYPAVALPDGERALFQPDAGISHAERAWRAFARGAVAAGARLQERTTALAVRPSRDGVEVETDAGTLRAPVVVVTAGPWARRLLAPLGIELPVRETRETVAYCRVDDGTTVPPIVEWRGPPYFFALASPGQGVKVGRHMEGVEADPDQDGPPDAGTVARIGEYVRRRFPSAETPPFHAETCFYTTTPDERFILERHGPIVVGSACSGHGFKFAPLQGERLADLAIAGA